MNTYDLFWSPEGRKIATVKSKNYKSAIRKAPYPYKKYLGEVYAELLNTEAKHYDDPKRIS